MKRLLLVPLLVIVLGTLVVGQMSAGNKVQVCHRPPEKVGNTHIIEVSVSALPDHLAHGDHFAFGGFCYVVVLGDVDHDTSEQDCVSTFGGHLASIHSQQEDDFISGLVDPAGVGNFTARIGGFEENGFTLGPTGVYTWTDGSPWEFENWRDWTGEPNRTPDDAPASVQFWPNTNGILSGWNDIPAGDPLDSYVCKYAP